jgi:glycosyltransferase involved in cell wall biosynthesis
MQVVVDGIIFELNKIGGIARLFREILPRMCSIDDAVDIHMLANRIDEDLFAEASCVHSIYLNPPFERLLRPRRLLWPVIHYASGKVKKRATRHLRNHIWHPTYYVLPQDWLGPMVITVHDMLYELYPLLFRDRSDRFFQEQKKRCVDSADALICVSETTARDLQDYWKVSSRKIHIIPHAYSDTFRVLRSDEIKHPIPTGSPYLLYVGGRRHYKNFDLLLEAYSRWDKRKDVALLVVGKRWSPQEQRRLVELRIEHQVQLLTEVDDMRLCQLYNGALAFIYPSLYEGFGIPLLEAAACGCPVIASNIPSSREVAGDYPIYFDPRVLASLVAAFDIALSEGRHSNRIDSGLQQVKQYSWERCAQQTLEIYRTL